MMRSLSRGKNPLSIGEGTPPVLSLSLTHEHDIYQNLFYAPAFYRSLDCDVLSWQWLSWPTIHEKTFQIEFEKFLPELLGVQPRGRSVSVSYWSSNREILIDHAYNSLLIYDHFSLSFGSDSGSNMSHRSARINIIKKDPFLIYWTDNHQSFHVFFFL